MGRNHTQTFELSQRELNLSRDERERYSRQILLYGGDAQMRLKAARVVVVGAGGIGTTLLPLLAASGIGTIEIFDGDKIEMTNLGRQYLFRERQIGQNKAVVAAETLRDLNPHVDVIAHARPIAFSDANLIAQANLVCEGSDSVETKLMVNALALTAKRPAIIAALGKSQGHAMLVSGHDTACYACVFGSVVGDELPTCASEGILSTFPAVVAATVAQISVNELLEPHTRGQIWLFEKNNCRSKEIKKRLECQVASK